MQNFDATKPSARQWYVAGKCFRFSISKGCKRWLWYETPTRLPRKYSHHQAHSLTGLAKVTTEAWSQQLWDVNFMRSKLSLMYLMSIYFMVGNAGKMGLHTVCYPGSRHDSPALERNFIGPHPPGDLSTIVATSGRDFPDMGMTANSEASHSILTY